MVYQLFKIIENQREKKKDFICFLFDLDKVYDKIPRDILWWVLERKDGSTTYIDVIRDIYGSIFASVKVIGSVFRVTFYLFYASLLYVDGFIYKN